MRGEAGSGKTRLLREFNARARGDGAAVLSGSCVEVSDGNLPFVPVRTALRHLVQTRPEPSLDALLGATRRDLHVLLPELADVMPGDRHRRSPHAFEVVASVVAALGREGPVVLTIDDAQWADQSTLQLLRYLLQPAQPLPLLILVAYRGEDLPVDAARRKGFEELSRAADDVISVDPLDAAQVSELVRGIGVELSPTSMARLKARCSGLPFLVEELVAAERDGVTPGIPRRVRDVVRLRLGAMPEDAQLLVALVAVAARPLRHRVLMDAAHLPTRRFAAALDAALTANLLVADTEERTYGFRHDLSREIVHNDLLTASRLELHVRLAVALQAALPVDAHATLLGEVAHHWLQSDANEEHALRAALLAARASTRAFAHPEALAQYEHVLVLWSRVRDPELIAGTDVGTVQTEAAEAAHWAGDMQAALRHVDQALAITSASSPDAVAVLHERRALYSWLDSGRLTAHPEQLLDIGSRAIGERMRASDLVQRGKYLESVEHAHRALDLARSAGSRNEELRAQVVLGVGLAMSDRIEQGMTLLLRARQDAVDLQRTELIVSSHINLTFVLLANGMLDEAARISLLGMDEVHRHGIAGSDGALVAVNAAEALTRLGRLDEAEALVASALDTPLPAAVESVLLLGRAEIEVLSGRYAAAERTLEAVSDLAPLENDQFRQQLHAWEAELQLWNPAGGRSVRIGDLRRGLGSDIVGADTEDVPLTARLLWLGVRADADATVWSTTEGDGARRRTLIEDGHVLATRAQQLATQATTDGMRRQVDGFVALIAAEESRLHDRPEPRQWRRAADANSDDPYLRAYALWRQGCACRALRRRRDAASALQEAHSVAAPLGMRALVDAITAAGLSLDIKVDQLPRPRASTARATRPYNLTAKETEVLALLVQGYTNRRIGSTLRMTEKTASVHVSRILAKLSVGSRGEAVARAYELGLASLPTGR